MDKTTLNKDCLKEVKKVWNGLVNKYGITAVKSSFNKTLNWERERIKLSKKKAELEKQLQEVNKKLH